MRRANILAFSTGIMLIAGGGAPATAAGNPAATGNPAAAADPAAAAEPSVPAKAPCAVCTRRGATHGEEPVAAHRVFLDRLYTFCSQDCAETFDRMPEGYAVPVLPRPAPDVALTAPDGSPVPLRVAGTRAVLVDFWATWCKPCLESMPELERLHAELSGRGLRVVGISIDEDRQALQRFLRKHQPVYPIAHDSSKEQPAWWAFRVPAVPALFLLDREGNVVAQWNGGAASGTLESAVEALLEAP